MNNREKSTAREQLPQKASLQSRAIEALEALRDTAVHASEKFRVSFVLSFNDRSELLRCATAAKKVLEEDGCRDDYFKEMSELANAVEMLAIAMFLAKNQRDQDGLQKILMAAEQLLESVTHRHLFGEKNRNLRHSIDDLWHWIHRNTNNKFEML